MAEDSARRDGRRRIGRPPRPDGAIEWELTRAEILTELAAEMDRP